MYRDIILQIYSNLVNLSETLRSQAVVLEPYLEEQYSPEVIEEIDNIDQELTYLEQQIQNLRSLIDESLP